VLRVATRGSALARWQAERVVALLDVEAELVITSTRGDRSTDVPIHSMGGTGVFVKEVEEAVLEGRADAAVHSAKDLPSATADGLALAAVLERGDPRDALVGTALDRIPTGARIGTGSVRRRAQLAHVRPDLTFGELRGNVPTRLDKAAAFSAVVVAAVALDRLGLGGRIAQRLEPEIVLPQVGQGALAVECRADDAATRDRLGSIDDGGARAEVAAERAYLARLGGGCNLPCGALGRSRPDGTVVLEALLASLDGRIVLRATGTGRDPEALGAEIAHRLLEEEGGRLLLDDAIVSASPGSDNWTSLTPQPER
jgi:hydroxymethylbilane synthase